MTKLEAGSRARRSHTRGSKDQALPTPRPSRRALEQDWQARYHRLTGLLHARSTEASREIQLDMCIPRHHAATS